MLPKSLNYDHLYNTFNLNIPPKFNIASATIDKFANTNRIALKNLKFLQLLLINIEKIKNIIMVIVIKAEY